MLYNRSLHVDDYNDLARWVNRLKEFEHHLLHNKIPYRKDHEHREWEYASVLQQLDELHIQLGDRILDTGSGGSYLPIYLAKAGYRVQVSDSMAYGDIVEYFLIPQCLSLGLEVPVRPDPVESLSYPNDSFDVSLCISVIEHVSEDRYHQALRELYRVTRPGGYIFITSDFFRDIGHADKSPFREIQHNLMTPESVMNIPSIIPVSYVGEQDFTYKGDWVNGYSFVNMCFQRSI